MALNKHQMAEHRALKDVLKMEGVARAKGFKRVRACLAFERVDADIFYDTESLKWVCNVFTMYNGKRDKLVTRRAHEMLFGLLKAVV